MKILRFASPTCCPQLSPTCCPRSNRFYPGNAKKRAEAPSAEVRPVFFVWRTQGLQRKEAPSAEVRPLIRPEEKVSLTEPLCSAQRLNRVVAKHVCKNLNQRPQPVSVRLLRPRLLHWPLPCPQYGKNIAKSWKHQVYQDLDNQVLGTQHRPKLGQPSLGKKQHRPKLGQPSFGKQKRKPKLGQPSLGKNNIDQNLDNQVLGKTTNQNLDNQVLEKTT